MLKSPPAFRCSAALVAILWCATTPVSAQGSGVTLIRNNDVASLDPISPPIASLFDLGTGQLLGQELLQDYQYIFYGEALDQPGDGPLVLYQLTDPDQTLLLSKVEDGLELSSFSGDCRVVDAQEISAIITSVPRLTVEYQHAFNLYGVMQYPSGIVCVDDIGLLSIATIPVILDSNMSVGLVFHRESLDVPIAYIWLTMGNVFDYFNSEGGLRYDVTDITNPVAVPLDENGQPLPPFTAAARGGGTSCLEVAFDYYRCLTQDPDWLLFWNALADETMHFDATVETALDCLALYLDPSGTSLVTCTVRAGIGFTALVVSGTGNLLQGGGLLCDCDATSATCSGPPGSPLECVSGATCNCDGGTRFAYCQYPETPFGSCTTDCGPGFCETGGCFSSVMPLSWWPGEGNARDAVGGNHGMLLGDATFEPGVAAGTQAFSFDGIDDYVDFGDVLNEITVPFTVEGWIRTPGAPQQTRGLGVGIFVSDDTSYENGYHGIFFQLEQSNRLSIAFGDGDGGSGPGSRRTKVSNTAVPLNVWVHVAVVVRGARDMTIYINGEDAGGAYSGSGGPMVHGPYPARLGLITYWHPYWGTSGHFIGGIDEFSVYDRDITQAEIQAIISEGHEGTCSTLCPASQFQGTSDGWGVVGDYESFRWVSDVGNPPGSINAVDAVDGGTWYFRASTAFRGDQSNKYRGQLSYDLWVSAQGDWNAADVIIGSGGNTLSWYGATPQTQSWTTITVGFDETDSWQKADGTAPTQAEMLAVLADVTELRIRGEYKIGSDFAYLDNVLWCAP